MKKPTPKVSRHAGCILVQRPNGVDVCDPITNAWHVFPTMRAARWSATVYTRLAQAFGHNTAAPEQLELALTQLKD